LFTIVPPERPCLERQLPHHFDSPCGIEWIHFFDRFLSQPEFSGGVARAIGAAHAEN
jgi:hypothetical protein